MAATTKTEAPNFFEDLANIRPFFKGAFEGFAGAGKTMTAAKTVLGLFLLLGYKGSGRKVTIIDTETSSKFLKPLFDKAGIPVQVKRTRLLSDVKKAMQLLSEGDILLIDSITHIWDGHTKKYQRDNNRKRLRFDDWNPIKEQWREDFSDPFVNSKLHIIFTGRAAFEYDQGVDDEGEKYIEKSGVKMRAEGETAFEPDVVVYMERKEKLLDDKKEVWREATVLKDRSDILDGKTLKNPDFRDFEPIIRFALADAVETVELLRDEQKAEMADLAQKLGIKSGFGAFVRELNGGENVATAKEGDRINAELRKRLAAQEAAKKRPGPSTQAAPSTVSAPASKTAESGSSASTSSTSSPAAATGGSGDDLVDPRGDDNDDGIHAAAE